jgi:hypothetical protein
MRLQKFSNAERSPRSAPPSARHVQCVGLCRRRGRRAADCQVGLDGPAFISESQREEKAITANSEKSMALIWKENARKSEFTARAPIGGSYILAPFLHCWNVDYREKKGREHQQLGFARTLDEAKAIAQANAEAR